MDRSVAGSQVAVEREALLSHLDAMLDKPMLALSFAWAALLVAELVDGPLPPVLDAAIWVIWAVFVADFLLELAIAPSKARYLRSHVVTAVSLVLPAFRLVRLFAALRLFRAARVVRSVGLLRVLTSVNRGLASLRRTAAKRGLGYVVVGTVLVIFVGAAGMASVERPVGSGDAVGGEGSSRLGDFGEALWWTASTMTTGAPSEPATAEGRILGWLLSLYGLGVFGYLTATLASHFIGQERPTHGAGHSVSGQSPTV